MSYGIYKITNILNNKIYIGSSFNIEKRFKRHIKDLKENKHHNIHLQRSFNSYGKDNFVLSIIELTLKEELLSKEQYYLDLLCPYYYNNGFNIGDQSSGGDNLTNNPRKKDIIEKMTKSIIKRYANMTEDQKLLHSEKVKGENNPNWKGGKTHIKCPLCEKLIIKNKKTCINCRNYKAENNPFYGKKHSNKTKNKIRESRKNIIVSQETKEKCSKVSRDFYNSQKGQEYKEKLSQKMKGEKHFLYGIGHTEETKNKIRLKSLERHKNKTKEDLLCSNNIKIIRFRLNIISYD
jgi:group I intron endonuclease